MRRGAVDDTAGWVRACVIWLESPSNPLLTVADLEAVCAAPRKPGAIIAVDNTFSTPLNQQPLDYGATVSLQSATKFIGGHPDLLAGVATTKDDALWHALRKSRELTGATPGTLEAFTPLVVKAGKYGKDVEGMEANAGGNDWVLLPRGRARPTAGHVSAPHAVATEGGGRHGVDGVRP